MENNMKKRLICLVGMSALLSLPAFADVTPPPFDHFVLRLGGAYIFNARTQLSANRSDGVLGATINTQKDLGTDSAASTGRAEAVWRFASNHSLELAYYQFTLDGSRTVSRDLTFRDQAYTIGDRIDSELKLGTTRLEYLYSFYRSDKVDLGLGAGIYAVRTEASLSSPTRAGQSVDVRAPMPVIGARMDYRWTPKLDVLAAADLFFLNQGDYRGSMADLRVQLEHRTFKHVGFGVGFDHFNLNADATGDKWQGSVATDWNSALLYAAFRW
jgi:hypothetical protein